MAIDHIPWEALCKQGLFLAFYADECEVEGCARALGHEGPHGGGQLRYKRVVSDGR